MGWLIQQPFFLLVSKGKKAKNSISQSSCNTDVSGFRSHIRSRSIITYWNWIMGTKAGSACQFYWPGLWQGFHPSGLTCLRSLEFIKQANQSWICSLESNMLFKERFFHCYSFFPFSFWKFYRQFCHRDKRDWKRKKKPTIILPVKHNTFNFPLIFISHYPY